MRPYNRTFGKLQCHRVFLEEEIRNLPQWSRRYSVFNIGQGLKVNLQLANTVTKLVLTKFNLCESECIDPDSLVGEHVGMGHPPSAISAETGREVINTCVRMHTCSYRDLLVCSEQYLSL